MLAVTAYDAINDFMTPKESQKRDTRVAPCRQLVGDGL
jgi:hypothetical protein